MASTSYRANLISGHMPFASRYHGQTVIVPGRDQAFQGNVLQTAADEDKDKGIPQVYYMDNVMPTADGLQSVGYSNRLAGLPGVTDFQGIFVLRDSSENKFLFSPSNNQNYIYDATVGAWAANNSFVPDIAANKLITVAYIAGITYVFFQGIGMYQYDTTTKKLIPVVLTGVVASALNGITESGGFLIAWSDFVIYRSQITNLTDFTPDFSLGSGSSTPEDLNGKIVVCYPTIGGFIIYCAKNAVGASFTQNLQFPFTYREIKGSAGITDPNHVAWNNNTTEHYAWTLAGLQKVNRTDATLAFAQMTDFFTSKIFQDYNAVTGMIDETKLTGALIVRLALIGTRWLVISFGVNSFTHAWVHDLAYRRWGKLKKNHVACFELYLPNFYGEVRWTDLGNLSWDDLGSTTWIDFATGIATTEAPREIFAVLSQDGTVDVVNFDDVHVGDTGVIVLGKYQLTRERWNSIQSMTMENIDQTFDFNVKIWSSLDGKNINQVTVPYLLTNQGLLREYLSTAQGLNQSICITGTFHLPSVELEFKIEGRNR